MTTRNAGDEGLVWFVAKIESIEDPNKLGRVGIRAIPNHDDLASIQKKDLLWAMPIMPNTCSSKKGMSAIHGLVPETFVVGFYADGKEKQIPLIFGTWNGEGDLPPEALGNGTTAKKLPIGYEKPFKHGAKYPYNKVTKTEAGHIFEMDDTPGAERLHLYHSKGSYIEWDFTGSRNDGIMGNYHQSTAGIRNDFTKSIHNIITIGAFNILSGLSASMVAGASASIKAGASVDVTSALATSVSAGGAVSVTGGADVSIKSLVDITSTAPIVTSNGGSVTMTGLKNKKQKFQLAEDLFSLITFNDTTAVMLDTTGISATAGVTTLELLTSGGIASLSGTSTFIRGTTTAQFISPATVITGNTSAIINAGGINTLTMTSAGANWVTGNMDIVPAGYMSMRPTVSYDVRSATVGTWSSASTLFDSSGTLTASASGAVLVTSPVSASLLSPGGAVTVGGTALTATIGASDITVGIGSTGTVNISATGAITITCAAGITMNGPVQVNGTLNTSGVLSMAGVQVRT